MANNFQNSNLVIRNGTFLLFRMLIVLFLGFFATRLSLHILGDEKFGIYNIVGGIIAVFAIISLPIRDSLQRFFNVELANPKHSQAVVLNTAVKIIYLMVLVITILYETIGLYLINYVIHYPKEECLTVNLIFQISALANIFGFVQLPYLSLLFSRENMSVPAICEIGGAVLRVVLLYLIVFVPINILIPYASIFLVINLIICFFYRSYCRKAYPECFITNQDDSELRRDMLHFSGWSFIESVAGISLTYISNIFINIFGGLLYNTAYGVSKQLQNAVVSFTTNVVKAAEPQITSGTAVENYKYRDQLLMTTMKVSFLFIAYVYILFHFDGDWLLKLWLGKVPLYVVEFCDLMLLSIVFSSITSPFRTLIMATGKVKTYFVCYGLISLMSMILMFVFLRIGFPVISVMYLIVASYAVMLVSAIYFAKKEASINVVIVMKNIIQSLITLIITGFAYYFVHGKVEGGTIGILICVIVSFLLLLGLSYELSFNLSEKNKIRYILKSVQSRIVKKKVNKI